MGQSIRILTLDDNEFDRETIHRALDRSHLDVELYEAETPEQAQDLLKLHEVDCMLLDYLMPTTTGLDFLDKLDDDSTHPAVVMLTGMGDERVAVEAMKSGVHEYINKNDMSTSSISRAIENAMSVRQQQRDEQLRQSELEQMSFYDSLTGLANRNLLMNRLNEHVKRARRHSARFCVILLDLNGFKAVNDTLGHEAGDRLLQVISSRLAKVSRESDTVARLGGDEFVILLSDEADYAGASVVARKIIEAIETPVQIDDEPVQVGASLGIAMYPDHGFDTHTLLHHADKAMYKAKQNSMGYCMYSAGEEDRRASRISGDLPEILTSDNMLLHYQPKVMLDTGALCGAEVLIRWQHPVLGMLPPQEFIPIAEKSMLIRELSYKLIDQALSQYASWAEKGVHTPLSINLSTRVLNDIALASTIDSIRKHYHIDASQITLEITESALISEPKRACKILEELVSEGFCISIDDFGTGYSSLSYLRDFPIHEIKIDKSFVQSVQRDVRNSYIIEAIIGLAQAFDATSVAEGLENAGLWKQMQGMGCTVGQGYHISAPCDARGFRDWHRSWVSAPKRPAVLTDTGS